MKNEPVQNKGSQCVLYSNVMNICYNYVPDYCYVVLFIIADLLLLLLLSMFYYDSYGEVLLPFESIISIIIEYLFITIAIYYYYAKKRSTTDFISSTISLVPIQSTVDTQSPPSPMYLIFCQINPKERMPRVAGHVVLAVIE